MIQNPQLIETIDIIINLTIKRQVEELKNNNSFFLKESQQDDEQLTLHYFSFIL